MIKNIWRDYIARVRNNPLKKYGGIIEKIWRDYPLKTYGVIILQECLTRFAMSPILKFDPFLETSEPKVSEKIIKK